MKRRATQWVTVIAASLLLAGAAAAAPHSQEAGAGPVAGQQDAARERFIAALRLAEQGQYEAAITAAEEGAQMAPADPDGLNLLGQLYEQVDRLDDAERSYLAAMQADSEWPEPFRNLGALYMRREQFSAAVAPLVHATGLQPDDPLLHVQLGIAFRESGRTDRAADAFQKAWDLEPDEGRLALDVAIARRASGDLQASIDAAERAVELMPDNPLPHTMLAQMYVESDRVEYLVVAPSLYRRVLEMQPEQAEVWVALAYAYNQIAIRDQAEQALRRAIELGLDRPDVRFSLGQTLSRQQKFAAAEAEYDRVLAIQPDEGNVHYMRGEARFNLNRFDEALEDFDQAIRLLPGDVPAILAAVKIHMVQGDLDAAEAKLESARRTGRMTDQLGLALGRLWVRQGRNEEALTILDQTLASNPDLIEGKYLRGQALLKLGRAEEGRAALAEYQRKFSEQRGEEVEQLRFNVMGRAQVYVLRARVYLNEGRMDEALEQMIAASELAPLDATVWEILAEVHDARGEPEQAAAARARAAEVAASR